MPSLSTLNNLTGELNGLDIGRFLSSRSGSEMVRLMQSMRDPRAQAALTTALLLAPPAVSGRSSTPEKAKKALNAFVGFRCYYIMIPEFKPWPMKKLSGLMGTLWDYDPNKSLWSLMTKAWSTIRDQIGKDNAPLVLFFRIICPYLNIPSPATYLQQLGWDFCIDKDNEPTVSRDRSHTLSLTDAGVAAAALSVEDIINHCQAQGYAQQYSFDLNASMTSSMAFTQQYIQDQRLADKLRRRTQRKVARDTGFAADFQERIEKACALEGIELPQDRNEIYQFGSERDTADDAFHAGLSDSLSEDVDETNNGTAGYSEDSAPNTTGYAANTMNRGAFRQGADTNTTLPFFRPGFSN